MRRVLTTLICACTLVIAGCASLTTAQQEHGGIRYSFPRDLKSARVEKARDGGLMYDSPQLTVDCRNGQLTVNGVNCGPVKEHDHVEVTDLGTVLVNGQRRADSSTGAQPNRKRIEHTVK